MIELGVVQPVLGDEWRSGPEVAMHTPTFWGVNLEWAQAMNAAISRDVSAQIPEPVSRPFKGSHQPVDPVSGKAENALHAPLRKALENKVAYGHEYCAFRHRQLPLTPGIDRRLTAPGPFSALRRGVLLGFFEEELAASR